MSRIIRGATFANDIFLGRYSLPTPDLFHGPAQVASITFNNNIVYIGGSLFFSNADDYTPNTDLVNSYFQSSSTLGTNGGGNNLLSTDPVFESFDHAGCGGTDEVTFIVQKADQEITIESIADKDAQEADFEVVAVTSSGLELNYAILSGLATINTNLVGLTGASGTVEIAVTQEGKDNFNSASATVSFEVLPDPCEGFEATASVLQNVSCNDGVNGSFEISLTAGTAPFTYDMNSTTQENSLFENLAAGSYEVTVTDANGCIATAIATIIAPEPLVIESEVSENNSIDGNASIQVTASGGDGDYTFSWSTGETVAAINGLFAGTYELTVTDGNGCSISETFSIGGVTANEELKVTSINFYPNPAQDQLTIEHVAAEGTNFFIDLRGNVVKTVEVGNELTSIDILGHVNKVWTKLIKFGQDITYY
jgi:hypothetical protein